jgi:hypothetical protein
VQGAGKNIGVAATCTRPEGWCSGKHDLSEVNEGF